MNNIEYKGLEYYQEQDRLRSQKNHEWYVKRKYKLTPAEYQALLKKQLNSCAICKTPQSARRLSVDHNHNTGKNRGLLCTRCNMGLGYFVDSEYFLQNALNYLISHRE